MPIGGKAYYETNNDKQEPVDTRPSFIKRLAGNRGTETQPQQSNLPATIAPAPPVATTATEITVPQPSERLNRPAKRRRATGDEMGSSSPQMDMAGMEDICAQVLDLAQKVHSIATRAEAAVVRAEAAVVKADLAVSRAESAGARSETALSKMDAAVQKAELFASRSELASTKAGLAAGKAELAAGLSSASGGLHVMTSTQEGDHQEPMSALTSEAMASIADTARSPEPEEPKLTEAESPLGEIALLSRKLRSGMRQIEQQNEADVRTVPLTTSTDSAVAEPDPVQTAPQDRFLSTSQPFSFTRKQTELRTMTNQDRENVAPGLVRVEHDSSIPRVAPFIVSNASSDESSNADDTDASQEEQSESAPKRRNGLGYAV